MEIRRATAGDAALVTRLNREVQQLHAGALPHLFKPPSDEAFPPGAFAELIADDDAFVLIGEVGGEAVGYLYGQVAHRPANAMRHTLDVGYVHHLSVDRAHQGHGYGERLLGEAVALFRAKGIPRVELDVWAFNTNAQRFFTRQGFAVFNQRMCLEFAGEGSPS